MTRVTTPGSGQRGKVAVHPRCHPPSQVQKHGRAWSTSFRPELVLLLTVLMQALCGQLRVTGRTCRGRCGRAHAMGQGCGRERQGKLGKVQGVARLARFPTACAQAVKSVGRPPFCAWSSPTDQHFLASQAAQSSPTSLPHQSNQDQSIACIGCKHFGDGPGIRRTLEEITAVNHWDHHARASRTKLEQSLCIVSITNARLDRNTRGHHFASNEHLPPPRTPLSSPLALSILGT